MSGFVSAASHSKPRNIVTEQPADVLFGFRQFECLAREPNRCFTRNQLFATVWDGQRRAATTIRSAVFELRSRFRKAGMDELADALRAEGCAYVLIFDDAL